MLRLLNSIKRNLLKEGKVKTFIFYTVGEVFLVVVGILIAFQIESWNENRKAKAEIIDIYKQIVYDLDNNILQFTYWVENYENKEYVYDKVISDSRTIDLLDDGLSRLMAGSPTTLIRTNGINRLKSISAKDSISLKLIDLYDGGRKRVTDLEKEIDAETWLLVNTFRDNYDWYPEWMSKKINKDNSSKELQEYFVNNQEYRRYVISSYNKIYNNYIPTLKIGIIDSKKMKEAIEVRINSQ